MKYNDILNNYLNLFIDFQQDYIVKTENGFVVDSCNNMVLSILTHCVDCIEIFNDKQLTNINNFINKIKYGC